MYSGQEDRVDEGLISWLSDYPEVIRELRRCSGLDK